MINTVSQRISVANKDTILQELNCLKGMIIGDNNNSILAPPQKVTKSKKEVVVIEKTEISDAIEEVNTSKGTPINQ